MDSGFPLQFAIHASPSLATNRAQSSATIHAGAITDHTDVLTVDIFVNCIYLSHKIPHFVDHDSIKAAGASRKLAVIADVSCDTTNPNNPIPLYDINTTFDKPTVDVDTS